MEGSGGRGGRELPAGNVAAALDNKLRDELNSGGGKKCIGGLYSYSLYTLNCTQRKQTHTHM